MSGKRTDAWTEERVDLLKKTWPEGLPASAMAARLNKLAGTRLSRCAVIGKVHRMGIECTRPPKPVKAPRAPPRPYRRRVDGVGPQIRLAPASEPGERLPILRGAVPMPRLRCVEVVSQPVAYLDRTRDQCAYLLDGHDDLTCCGAPVQRRNYCRGHADLTASERQAPAMNENFMAGLGNRAPARRQIPAITGWGDAA